MEDLERYVEDLAQAVGSIGPWARERNIPVMNGGARFDSAFAAGHRGDATQSDYDEIKRTACTTVSPLTKKGQHWAETDYWRIFIRDGLAPSFGIKTIFHEEAHVLFHKLTRSQTLYRRHEREAEVVAYLVARSYGIDATEASALYLKHWNGSAQTVRATAAFAVYCAKRIILLHLEKGATWPT